ncbi:zinc metalloprotease [Undibacterium crateris]|uniref:hypothetical protein n=1 Tax=Undibacterium crateris TaxID=2528175 RepID=UPI00138A3830|nr:hypothetical protein [Undibacterium crateris]NDI86594.1 hypothetical protein [Undibacterium crateris]
MRTTCAGYSLKRDSVAIGGVVGTPKLMLASPPISEKAYTQKMTISIAHAKEKLQLNEGDIQMWFPDTPISTVDLPVMYLAANKLLTNTSSPKFKFGVCQIVSSESTDVYPILNAGDYVSRYLGKSMDFSNNPDGSLRKDTTVRVIKQPKHGRLGQPFPNENRFIKYDYNYIPDLKEDFVGNDQFIIDVSADGITVRIYYTMSVDVGQPYQHLNEKGEKVVDAHRCPKERWKISSNLPTGTDDFTNWQTTANLNAMLANASGSLTNFSDLAGTAVGQTTGTGNTAQITLDTNAAGHGWFIDSTPDQNDEFLPTSNPDVWIAKAGSAADGKMDMLSALLHEYGDALGIEHSGDDGDFMVTSLQPGERRLPGSEELSLMAMYRLRRADYGWVLNVDQTQLASGVELAASHVGSGGFC